VVWAACAPADPRQSAVQSIASAGWVCSQVGWLAHAVAHQKLDTPPRLAPGTSLGTRFTNSFALSARPTKAGNTNNNRNMVAVAVPAAIVLALT